VAALNSAPAGTEYGIVTRNIPSGTQPVSGTVNPSTGQGKTLSFAAIAQGAAGTTALVGADATKKIKVVSYVFVMSATGTVKFTDGAVDLSGAMDIVANGGVSSPNQPDSPVMETAAINRPLNIVTTAGAARGHMSYFLET
jgi:hypothetical protein